MPTQSDPLLHESPVSPGDCPDKATVSKADLPEPDVMAVGHEPKGSKGLLLGDLGDVVPELFVGLARVAGASLGFHDGEHLAACVLQAILVDAGPEAMVRSHHLGPPAVPGCGR